MLQVTLPKTRLDTSTHDAGHIAELSVIIPTFNEFDNVAPLLEKLERALTGIHWEAVFVDDDSPDGTSALLRQHARTDPRVRVVQRIGRRGLSSAVVEGILSTSTPYIAVIDADMQHDERLLPKMFDILSHDEADLVVGSRYVAEGGVGDWTKSRQRISHAATLLSHLVMKAPLADPMSGFFMITREAFETAVRALSIQGYKILLDIVASASPALRVKELPYVFKSREHGESKLDTLVSLEFLTLLLDKLVGRWVPVKLVLFGFIGGLGVFLHMAVLGALLLLGHVSFLAAQTVATVAAMTGNFFLNNIFTYRDRRLRGVIPILRGLLSFYVICGIGAVANVGIANFAYTSHHSWWVSGLAGILVAVGWNYGASSLFTWRNR